MKWFIWNLVAAIFGGKKIVRITSSSQTEVLKSKMEERRLSHGATVIADLPGVKVVAGRLGNPKLYFCPMGEIEIRKNLTVGDGGEMPEEVALKSLLMDFKGDGLYNLKNVELSSNGKIQIARTSQTSWEKVKSFA